MQMKNNDAQNKKGISWGQGVSIAIVLFVAATLTVVGYLVSLDYQMVADNHYEKAEKYQQHIDRLEQAEKLEEPVTIEMVASEKMLEIQFPRTLASRGLQGTVEFYRPNDAGMDRKLKLDPDKQGFQQVPLGQFTPGRWQVRISWTSGDKSYFKQQYIFL